MRTTKIRIKVSHVMNRGGKKMEEEYKGRLLVILGVVRFLLLQALSCIYFSNDREEVT